MAGSITEVYAQVKLSVKGVQNDLLRQLNPSLGVIENKISSAVKAGFAGNGGDISNSLSTSINAGINSANFSGISTGIQQSLGGLSFSNITSDLNSSIQQGLSGINTSSLQADLNSAVSSLNSSLQSAINGVNASNLSSGLQNATQSAVQQGAQQGINGVNVPSGGNSGIAGGVSNATQGGAVKGFKMAGPAIVAGIAALGIGAAVKGSISEAMEKNLSEVKISAQLNLDKDAERRFKEASTTLWQSGLSDSREEVNETLGALISSSAEAKKMSGKELGELGKQVQGLVSLYDLSADELAQTTGAMVKNGLAEDLKQANDLLTAAFVNAPAQAREEIVAAASEYGRNYASMGLNGKQFMANLVQGAKEGAMGVDKVGDAVKEVELKVGGLDKSAEEALSGIGMSGKQIKGFRKAFAVGGDEGEKAFKSMLKSVMSIDDPIKKQQTAIALFGTQMEDLGAKNFDDFAGSILNADLVLGDVNRISDGVQAKLGESFAVQAQGFKNTWSDITAMMGEGILTQIMPHMKTLLEYLKTNGSELSKTIGDSFAVLVKDVLPQILPLMGEIMPIVSAILGLITPIVETLVPIIKDAIPMIQGFLGFVLETVKAIEPIIPALLVIAGVIQGMLIISNIIGVVQTLIGLFGTLGVTINLSFWPVTLVVAAIVAVIAIVVLLVKNWDAVKEAVINVWNAVTDFFVSIGRGIGDLWNGMMEGFRSVGDFIMGIIDNIIRGFQEVIGWITSLGKDDINMNVNTNMNGGSLPQMATGGDIIGATALIAGEKDPETIVNRGLMNDNLEKQNALIAGIMSGDVGSNNEQRAPELNYYTVNAGGITDPYELVNVIEKEKDRRARR